MNVTGTRRDHLQESDSYDIITSKAHDDDLKALRGSCRRMCKRGWNDMKRKFSAITEKERAERTALQSAAIKDQRGSIQLVLNLFVHRKWRTRGRWTISCPLICRRDVLLLYITRNFYKFLVMM
jgi:hypothetical protein